MFVKESLHGVGVGRPYGAAFLALESLTALARALAKHGSGADAPTTGPKPATA